MKGMYKLFVLLMVVVFIASCGATEAPPADTPVPEPTQAEAEPTKAPEPEPTKAEEQPTEAPPAAGLTCDEPIKIGLITDLSGSLAVYGTMIERSFLLGMEYAAGAPGTEDGVFTVDDCEIQVFIRDDQTSPETTATLARELIDVEEVDILVGTVSS
ncbi:MAG: ABC transporter substrate-binding protein, partial [Anaerolineae bacterium]